MTKKELEQVVRAEKVKAGVPLATDVSFGCPACFALTIKHTVALEVSNG